MHPQSSSNGYDSEWEWGPPQQRSQPQGCTEALPQDQASAQAAPAAPELDDELRAAILRELRGPEQVAATCTEWRVLAYERVSKSVQVSIPDQKRVIEEDVARYGATVERHRWDVGSRWDNDRVDYRALHADIESRQYTHLWTFKADRLGGDDLEFVATIRKARQCGMIVRDTVVGEITDELASLLGLISYWEIKNNHYRAALALHGKHLEGVKLGSVAVGYRAQCQVHPCRCGLHGKHVPDEVKGPLVQKLFRRYADGEGLTSLQRWWNAETGERREVDRIRSILRNPYYAGIIVNCREFNGKVEKRGKRPQGEWKVGTHEQPLVDIQTFATVQARLRSQENVGQHRERGPAHPMSGLLHCVGCGRRMRAKHGGQGKRSYDWECPICHRGRSVRKVEVAVHGLLATIPFPEEAAIADYAADQARLQQALKAELGAIDVERDRINRRRSAWADALGDGTMPKDEYRAKIAETDRQLEELRQQQAALQDSHIAQPGRAALLSEVRAALQRMGNWTSTIEHMTQDERRGMYRCMLKAIKIDLAAGRMTVDYTDALARWCGRASDTVPLPSQKVKGVG